MRCSAGDSFCRFRIAYYLRTLYIHFKNACKFQGLVKHFTVVYYAELLNSKVQYLRHIFLAVGEQTTPRQAILFKWSTRFLYLFKLFAVVIAAPFVVFCMFPVVIYCVTGQRVVLYPTYAPFVDDTTVRGYLILTSIHFSWSVQSAVGLIGGDLLMAFLLLHALPVVELIELSFTEMNEVCKHSRSVSNKILLKMQLRNILQMHKELSK